MNDYYHSFNMSFTDIASSPSNCKEDFNTTNQLKLDIPSIQQPTALQCENNSRTCPKPVELFEDSVPTKATQSNQQQQQNQLEQNVQKQNLFPLKQFRHTLGSQTKNGVHQVNHTDYNPTHRGELRANVQTQYQNNIETMRNRISNYDYVNQNNLQLKNQQEYSMVQYFNYRLNQMQAQINSLQVQIFQRNNEDSGNGINSRNFNDSNHLSKQKSYSLYFLIF